MCWDLPHNLLQTSKKKNRNEVEHDTTVTMKQQLMQLLFKEIPGPGERTWACNEWFSSYMTHLRNQNLSQQITLLGTVNPVSQTMSR